MKKFLSIILTICLILGFIPSGLFDITANAYTSGHFTYTVTNGEAEITSSSRNIGGAIRVPSTLGGYPVTSIGFSAFKNRTGLSSITISEGIKHISSFAFDGCTGLKSIEIPSTIKSIDSFAFDDCTKLNAVYTTDVSNWCMIIFKTLESNPLYYAHNLYLTNYSLVSDVIIPEEITFIRDYTFSGCSSIKNITMHNKITTIGNSAFSNCIEIESITIPDSVSVIDESAFSGCLKLKTIIIPENVTSISNHTFSGCSSIKNITIHDKMTSIGNNAFFDCTELEDITIPDSVSLIGESAFSGCTKLKSITMPKNIISISNNTFSGCTSIKNITMHNKITTIGNKAFNGCIELENITIPDSVLGIGESAFEGCIKLEKITIPRTVTNVGKSAFSGCSSLNSINLPFIGNGTSENANFGYIFGDYFGASNDYVPATLESVIILNDCNIEEYAFYDCKSLVSITLPKNVSYIANSAFDGCTNLANITIPEGLKSIGNWSFSDCSSLSNITIPKSIEEIGEYAFYKCSSLANVYYQGAECQWAQISIDSSNGVLINAQKHYKIVGHNFGEWIVRTESTTALHGLEYRECSLCGGEETRETPLLEYDYSGECGENLIWTLNSTTGLLKILGAGDMNDYKSSTGGIVDEYKDYIKSVIIENGVTSIGNMAFYGYQNLKTVTVADTVSKIGILAFNNCTSLIKVKIYNKDTSFSTGTFRNATALILYGYYDSTTESYANDNNIPFTGFFVPNVPIVNLIGATKLLLKPVDGHEYSIDGVNWQQSNLFEGLIANESYTVYQRLAATKYTEASEISKAIIVVTNGQDYITESYNATHLTFVRKALLFETKNMAADINEDGVTDIRDLVRLKKNLVENEPRPLKGDINQDGLIDFADVDYLTDYLDGKVVNVELVYADVTCDGIINEDDLFALLEMVE